MTGFARPSTVRPKVSMIHTVEESGTNKLVVDESGSAFLGIQQVSALG